MKGEQCRGAGFPFCVFAIMELGDGQVSGLQEVKPEEFYGRISEMRVNPTVSFLKIALLKG